MYKPRGRAGKTAAEKIGDTPTIIDQDSSRQEQTTFNQIPGRKCLAIEGPQHSKSLILVETDLVSLRNPYLFKPAFHLRSGPYEQAPQTSH